MLEGAKINQSLLILGNCIQALSEQSEKNLKGMFIPYRGSKLTRILKVQNDKNLIKLKKISNFRTLWEEIAGLL